MILVIICILIIYLLRIILSVLIYKGTYVTNYKFDFSLAFALLLAAIYNFYKYLANYPVRNLTNSYIAASHDISLKLGRLIHIDNYYLSDALIFFICFLIIFYTGYKKMKKESDNKKRGI
ncbi:MAG: hypothetical protein A2231_13165 [Candidatus Firestonebacteria bacterium RIFOXYA2_FULL_40_8]|nr:MAG: hypothetical protein A2231_13165 [Candidatus Firestonebacteria bacterium RIFOXYA2_FULL_40_8]